MHNDLGNALREQAKADEAAVCYRRAMELKPDFAEAHDNLGNVLWDQQRPDEAVACWRRALALDPDLAERTTTTAMPCGPGKTEEAIACYRRAWSEARPRRPLSNLGNALKDQGKLEEAVACYQRALALKPEFAEAHYNLGNALKDQGKPEEAAACYRRALELKPDYVVAHSNLLMALQYCAGVTPAALAEAHADYDRRPCGGDPGANVSHASVRDLATIPEALAIAIQTSKPAGFKLPSRSIGRFSRSSRIMPMRSIFSAWSPPRWASWTKRSPPAAGQSN